MLISKKSNLIIDEILLRCKKSGMHEISVMAFRNTLVKLFKKNESLKAEVERLKGEKKNNPWCLKCKSPDCLVESDGTCAMIKIYLEAIK